MTATVGRGKLFVALDPEQARFEIPTEVNLEYKNGKNYLHATTEEISETNLRIMTGGFSNSGPHFGSDHHIIWETKNPIGIDVRIESRAKLVLASSNLFSGKDWQKISVTFELLTIQIQTKPVKNSTSA